MKLVHPELKQAFLFEEGKVNVWIIEHPSLFYEYVMQLFLQVNGKEGRFVLSENLKEMKLSKVMEVLLEPWSIDFSNRKIRTQLYEEMKTVAYRSENYERTQEVFSNLKRYILDLERDLPYAVDCPDEIDFGQLMKSLNVKLETETSTLLEQLLLYMKICKNLLHIEIFTLINIKCYLTDEELQELYNASFYEKFFLFLVENEERGKVQCENHYIIDSDMCEIVVDDKRTGNV